MKHKKFTTLLLSLLTIIAFAMSCSDSTDSAENDLNSSSGSSSNCPTKTCASFKSRAEAQAAYDSNKACYKNLDADGDGKVCESLK